jgi:hypothetical protein
VTQGRIRFTAAAAIALALALAGATLPGCFAVRRESEANALVNLDRLGTLEDQTDAPSYRSTRLDQAGLRPASTPPPERVRRVTREQATGGLDDVAVAEPADAPIKEPTRKPESDAVIARRGAEPGATRGPASPETVVVAPLDALVGQVSGRPVFASDFFEPMDARMLAEAERLGRREFLQDLREQVVASLRDVIRDELLLAEFEASLTPQQRQGIGTFVQSVREDLIRQSGGSIELANQSLLAEEGLTLEEKVEVESRQQLVRQMVGRLLRNRAWIPWRDVRREYLRNLEEFRPLPTARLRVMMVPASDAERLASVQRELAEGAAFAEVAERYSVFRAAEGGLYETEIAPEGFEQTTFFADEALNERAAALEQGQIAGPFEWNDRRVWMTLEDLQNRTISLYESQEDLLDGLRQQRLSEVQREFFLELQERGSLSDVDRMEAELFRLGAERYLITQQADAPR